MSTPILQTKLFVPHPSPNLVSRARLLDHINIGVRGDLTLISAPAGFGKTTLVSEFVRGCPEAVSWLSLDEGDNDPGRFMAYLTAAIQQHRADDPLGAFETLQSQQIPPLDVMMTGIINTVASSPERLILVLDDYHQVTEPDINEAVAFLVDNLPPQMHLIVCSRSDPPWPLARLRASDRMTELRVRDLRFSPQEAAAFLNDVMGLQLSAEDVSRLENKTEGWIAGLQMAAISMKGQRDTSGFIRSFTGSNRFVLDYLVEEVLNRQSPEVRDFMLMTAILDRLTAPLCDILTGREDSQKVLEQLDEDNLFLMRLDDDRRWFRYHRLFTDLLVSILKKEHPEQVVILHEIASRWYVQNNWLTDAVRHGMASGNLERVIRIIEQNALTMVHSGELKTLAAWLEELPEEIACKRPRLCLAHAWVAIHIGDFDNVRTLLAQTEDALLEDMSIPIRERRRITGHILSIRAYLYWFDGEVEQIVPAARDALGFLPEDDINTRAWTLTFYGSGQRETGNLDGAEQAFRKSIALSRESGLYANALETYWELGVLQQVQGKLIDMVNSCQEALELADKYWRKTGQLLPIISYIYIRMAVAYLEMGEPEEAMPYARKGYKISKQWGMADAIYQAGNCYALTALDSGDGEEGLRILQQNRALSRQIKAYQRAYYAFESQFQLALGRLDPAVYWVDQSGLQPTDHPKYHQFITYLYFLRVRIAQAVKAGDADLTPVVALLEHLAVASREMGAFGYEVRFLAPMAVAMDASGSHQKAMVVLNRALHLAAPVHNRRAFLIEGNRMVGLLRKVPVDETTAEFVSELLNRMDVSGQTARSVEQPLVDPLTNRELQILQLLNSNLTSTEIAGELVIAVSTVRSHIKSIYSKLGVNRRHDAVTRAGELGLI